MQRHFNQRSMVFILLVFCLSIFTTGCSDDDEIDCTVVSAGLEATISTTTPQICVGGVGEFTITGTPGAVVTYNDGTGAKNVTLNASGVTTEAVSPEASTDYTLEKIAEETCEKNISGSTSIRVGGPEITENIIGTWVVMDTNDQSDGKTVTFLDDQTGTAPEDGVFTMYSSTLEENSSGFTWEYRESLEHLVLSFSFTALNYPVHYAVDLNDCNEIILRDVTHVVEPQNRFQLARQ